MPVLLTLLLALPASVPLLAWLPVVPPAAAATPPFLTEVVALLAAAIASCSFRVVVVPIAGYLLAGC